MRLREIQKLLSQIIESFYLIKTGENCLWEGTILEIGGRKILRKDNGETIDIDRLLPCGSKGKLIWVEIDAK